ncbi:asparagine synthase (glutamine-hydrolyzing) [Anaerosacchariphilus polymeriproducens]|uniref:asparagine synthase (glutamine-hydrolyzing) n=1 Tax=Anaerosacchariphilus polymeriproducens TaxID=1812858 RepID=A0A371AT37_9FIRM|nr:asparagine synthase (glutamine-hydrolyzing) [Anaerosacchariphilus polymeriproducens]RDU22725.1 asparagine synthase (glutamine-hydrolyzing) [Anaerosacchariphilus polymeriproducens]
MCGICGFIGEIEEREKILENMMEKIKHRGPDASGKYFGTEAALGFQRLSIVDLENGCQPMYNENKDIAIVFNGEIYNFKELKHKLSKKGHIFSNEADTECLVHEYEDYGTEMLNHIRGMFAFAIWDEKKQTLFAARDFFGIKPFYYAMIQGCFVFASEIKSILEFPGYEKQVNLEALEQYLSFQYSALEETFFKGIYKLQPGHYLTFSNGEFNVKQYFDPMIESDGLTSYSQLLLQVDTAIKESIDKHMMGDVEIGTHLSSGVDSSLIAASFKGDKTFTVGYIDENSPYNEIKYADNLSNILNKKNHSKIISSEDYWNAIPEVMYYMDEPLADPSAVGLYFVNKEASNHVKVALSGEGVDELFAGYNIYKEPKALKGYQYLAKPLRKIIAKIIKNIPFEFKGKNYLIRGSKELEERFIGNANIFNMEERNKILKQPVLITDASQLVADTYKKICQNDPVSKMQYIDLKHWLPGDILLKADKMSMANSIEVRVPYLDKEVFHIARKITDKYKIQNHITKFVFRQVANKYIPKQTAEKKKLGFPTPIRVWLKEDEYYNKVKEAFEGNSAELFFNKEQLLVLLNQHRMGKRDNSRKIWAVYVFLIWYQVYFINEREDNFFF